MGSLRKRVMSSIIHVLMLRVGCLMERLGAPQITMRMLIARLMSSTKEYEQEAGAKHDAKDLAKDVDMDVIGQPGAEADWTA
jgi:hypothetical protein